MPIHAQVRRAEPHDIAQLINLQFEVYPPHTFDPINRWNASSLEAHQRVFPDGQLVVEVDDRIVAAAVTMLGHGSLLRRPHTFLEAIGSPLLDAHASDGDALYGVDICVSPHFRRQGHARRLYEARFALQARLGVASFLAGARIPGYSAVKDAMTAADYVAAVVAGQRVDATLTAQLKLGWKAITVMPKYLPDPETADHAVLIERRLPD